MGLAAYGKPVYLDLMRELVGTGNGAPASGPASFSASAGEKVAAGRMRCRPAQFRLNLEFFRPLGKNLEECVDEKGEIVLPPLYSQALVRELGEPSRRGAEFSQRDKDIAASCQAHFEDVVLHSLAALHRRVPTENLVTAGGCALNGVCNARILRETPFKHSYIQCAASDDVPPLARRCMFGTRFWESRAPEASSMRMGTGTFRAIHGSGAAGQGPRIPAI